MTTITVVCDECGQEVAGLIDAGTMPDGEAFIMTGGFYIYDCGISCDDCVHGESGPEAQTADTESARRTGASRCSLSDDDEQMIQAPIESFAFWQAQMAHASARAENNPAYSGTAVHQAHGEMFTVLQSVADDAHEGTEQPAVTPIELGGYYSLDALPESDMEPNGDAEWVTDERIAISVDSVCYEFHVYTRQVVGERFQYDTCHDDRIARCVKISHIGDDGSIEREQTVSDIAGGTDV